MSSDLTACTRAVAVSMQGIMQQHDKGHQQHQHDKEQQQQQQPPLPSAAATVAVAAAAPTLENTQTILMDDKKKDSTSNIGLVTFEQVLNLIPTAEKGAYLQAMQRCPELVATESNPMRFLIRDDYNVWSAARRFVAYWEARREIFGETRAYLPILNQHHHCSGINSTKAGEARASAMDREDWAALATGWYALLPRTTQRQGSTGGGHAVLCVDLSRAKDHFTSNSFGPLARSAFYIRTVMAQLDITQTEGYIAVTLYSNDVCRAILKKEYQRLTVLLFDAFPVKMKVSFMVTVAQWQFFQNVLPIIERVFNNNTTTTTSSSSNSNSHVTKPYMLVPLIANSHQEILRKLEPHHLTQEGLPPSLGGTWSYDIFAHWVALEGGGIAPTPTALLLTKQQAADLDSFRQSYSTTSSNRQQQQQQHQQHPAMSVSSSCSSLDEMVVPATSSLKNSCPQTTTQLLTDFYEALDLIPFDQKSAYVQASQYSAALVQEESDPKMFLMCEQNNPQAAARRFVNYWNLRQFIFGQNAYLPLISVATTTTGQQAALTVNHLAEFNSGAYIILPKDKYGRVVHMYDRSKLMNGASGGGNKTTCCGSPEEIRMTKLACWFYFISLACRQMCMTTSPSSGGSSNYSMHMVCLMVVGPEFFDKPLMASMATEIKNMTTTALPVRHVDIHIICLPSSSPSCIRIVSEDQLAFMVDRMGRNTNVHTASCPQEMRDKLREKVGMRPEGIPVDFGGTWTMEKEGMEERQERLRTETQRLQQFRDAAVVLPMPPSSSSSSSLASMSLTANKHPHRRRRAVDCGGVGVDNSSNENHSQQEQQQQQQNKRRKTSVDEINMLQDAIDATPMDQKKDYLFASKTFPRLVQTESNPEMFLSVEPGRDCIAAARRITAYWKKRREIFGQDRAFSPMHLKNRRASVGGDDDDDDAIMSPADVAALRQGFVACIPKHAKNNNINSLWLGRRRGLPRETWLRILFYMLHVATENSEATQEVLHVLSEDSPEELRIFDELVREALPIRVAAAHLLCIPTPSITTSEKTSLEVLLPAAMQALSKPILDKTSIHMVQTEEEMHTRLEWCGFCREKLPTEVGGTLELQELLAKWIANRHFTESPPCRGLINASSYDQHASADDGISGNSGRNIANTSNGEEKDWHAELDETNVGVMRNSRCSLDEAIELMPEEDKQVYCEALAKVPEIVENESKPSWYLQHEKHNSWAASSRLALYWKKRKIIFGDRTFLPMNMTGEGALSKEGIAYFSTGALVFLPNDKKGRSVLCYDSSRAQGAKLGEFPELMFYAALICAQNRKSPVEGVVLLVTTSNTSMKDELGKMLDIVSVFPFTWHSIHIISKVPEKAFLSNFAFWEPTVLGSDRFHDKVIVHKVNSNEEIGPKLAAYGISEAGIPESCGGTWSYLQHARWQEQRIRLEWDLPLVGSGLGCKMFASNAKPRCELNENERTERRRRFNVLHSRRKRERDKVEREVLKKQADDLKRANMKLMLDNQRIEGLIRAAEAEVQIAERALLQQHAPRSSCYGFSQRAVPPGLERNFAPQGPMMCPRSHSSFPIQRHINPENLSVFCNEQYPNDGVLQNQNAYGLPDSLICGGNRGSHSVPTNPILHPPMATPSNTVHVNFSWQQPVLSPAAMFHTNDASSMALANGGGMLPPQPHQGAVSQSDQLSRSIAAMSNGFAPMDRHNPYSHPR